MLIYSLHLDVPDNTGFPPASRRRWKVLLQSGPLPDGRQALDAEDALKLRFCKHFRSLGREFFLGDERTLAANFAK